MRGLLSCLILISQVKDCFGVFSAGSLGPTKHKLFVCQCKLKALFISSNPCSFQLWGVQVCIYMSTKMLWLWLDLIGVIQSFGTVFCNVPRLVTVESESLDSQCDSALSHRSPSHLFFYHQELLEHFLLHTLSLVAHSPLLGLHMARKRGGTTKTKSNTAALIWNAWRDNKGEDWKVERRKNTICTVLPLSLAKSMCYLSFVSFLFRFSSLYIGQ